MTLTATDLEIQEVINEDGDNISEVEFDDLGEEEKIPIDESVQAIISDLNAMDPSDWSYTVEEEQASSSMTVEDSSFAAKREQLCELFSKRLTDGNWSFQASMPRKVRDPEFDALLQELGLTENRQYASTQWWKFKQNKGVYPPPSFESDSETLMRYYRRRIEKYTVEKVLAEALADTAAFKFQPLTVSAKAYEHFLLFARSYVVEIKLREMVTEMTEYFASTIAGATE